MALYLSLNLLSMALPFAFSFHPRLRFYQNWFAFWPAVLLTASVFLVWDVFFTRMGVWGFNPKYLLGLSWLGLPLEEWLFFICIPYASVFTYACFKTLRVRDYFAPYVRAWTTLLATASLIFGLANLERAYTASVCLATSLLLFAHLFYFRANYLGRFYFAYLVLLFPFLLVNGILTGSFLPEPVVWYNNAENLARRCFTVPLEDFAYAFVLILLNITLYEMLLARRARGQARHAH